MERSMRWGRCGAILTVLSLSAWGQNTLSNAGPGGLTVTMDGWGMYGSCTVGGLGSDLLYTPIGSTTPVPTTCWSATLFVAGTLPPPGFAWLATNFFPPSPPGQANNPTLTAIVPGRHYRTAPPLPTLPGFTIQIDHVLAGPDPATGPPREGSTLTHLYTVINTSAATQTVSLVRFLDPDLGPSFTNDRAGASRRLLDCAASPPFTHNREWVFQYDLGELPGTVVGISAEGLDNAGNPVLAVQIQAEPTGTSYNAVMANPIGFLQGQVAGDMNGDLLVEGAEPAGDYSLGNGLTFPSVPPGGTVRAWFRTRFTSLDPGSMTPASIQARDLTCTASRGNYTGLAQGPLLCVGGQGTCASIPAGAPIVIQMAAPAGGPPATHYVLYATFGQPLTGATCGSAEAGDFTLWGPPVGVFGLGASGASGVLGAWTGGGSGTGFALMSSIPGVALLPGPPAVGAPPCGATILTLPGVLPSGFSFTLQAVVVDLAAAGLPLRVSNAADVAIGTCACRSH